MITASALGPDQSPGTFRRGRGIIAFTIFNTETAGDVPLEQFRISSGGEFNQHRDLNLCSRRNQQPVKLLVSRHREQVVIQPFNYYITRIAVFPANGTKVALVQ